MFNKTEKLEPVLIRKDDHLIKAEKENLQRSLKDGQEIYDHFFKIGIEVTLTHLQALLNKATARQSVKTFVTDEMIKKSGLMNLSAVPIKKDKIKDLIDLPNISHIERRLNEMASHYANQAKNFKAEYFGIKNHKLVIIDGTDEQIEAANTHYTRNEQGHKLAEKLLNLSGQILDYAAFFGKDAKGNPNLDPSKFSVPGLIDQFRDLPQDRIYTRTEGDTSLRVTREHTGHKLDLSFIRRHERQMENKQ